MSLDDYELSQAAESVRKCVGLSREILVAEGFAAFTAADTVLLASMVQDIYLLREARMRLDDDDEEDE